MQAERVESFVAVRGWCGCLLGLIESVSLQPQAIELFENIVAYLARSLKCC